ncbi:MAG: hypothetical protein DHS80DRAFT_31915 [Piptocephalis tieghemiana]|nr:MAG: hypothetical protein DHS80DRAFT_31915 [Piptocephalis tieghemiana]
MAASSPSSILLPPSNHPPEHSSPINMTKNSGSGKGGGGKGGGGSKGSTPMTKSDASRIQSSGAKNPEGSTHRSAFDTRAQSSADKSAAQGKK